MPKGVAPARRCGAAPERNTGEGAFPMQDSDGIAELERRIAAALDRIGKGLDRMAKAAPAAAKPAPSPAASGDGAAEIARLTEALEVEKTANAQLAERLKTIKDREAQGRSGLEAKVERMTHQLDVQGLELQRMRKVTVQLREALRAMTEAAESATPEPHLINKAMLAELEALRAQRQSEVAEMDEILAELAPLIEETAENA